MDKPASHNQFMFPGGIANDDPIVVNPPKDRPPLVVMVGIDYDEFKPETYRGSFVIVSLNGEERERETFKSWDRALHYALSFYAPVLYLSSVDNYAADLKKAE